MGYQLKHSVLLSDLAKQLDLAFKGADIEVRGVAPFNNVASGELSFTKEISVTVPKIGLIVPKGTDIKGADSLGVIFSDNPRLDFIRALAFLEASIGFATYDFPSDIHPSVKLGQNVVIENGCKLAEGVVLEHNVVIHAGTSIGKNSRIRSCSSIGGDGFGFERLEDGTPLRFPHLGGVVIGENVEIGSLNSVARGTLSNTIISDYTKTDNLVHIAHNCFIGKSALITACAQFSGGISLGENVWIGPNTSLIQKITIGDNALVGLGAVVTKNVPENTVFAGNPAKKIRDI